MRVLILGGTTEASALARALAGDARIDVTVSLAGRTAMPMALPVPVRIGGFGGAEGLARYLTEHGVGAVIDATHPFAAKISRNAQAAARLADVPILLLCRPPWQPVAGDRWVGVSDTQSAADTLGQAMQRVFLTVGRQDLAPFAAAPRHQYVLRSVDPPPPDLVPAGATVILARGPFHFEDERRLLIEERIDVLVTKNSGGAATYAKLAAARTLGVRVVIVARPAMPDGVAVAKVAEVLDWLAGHVAPRGV